MDVKKVIQNVYKFNFDKCTLEDGKEIVIKDGINEFNYNFKSYNTDIGFTVTPENYINGLMYKSLYGGSIINYYKWADPELVSFSLNLYGLKKGSFYRVTVKSKNSKRYNEFEDVTDNRSLKVSLASNKELIIWKDLSEVYDISDISGIFRASGNEDNLSFEFGKILINDIVIDEVEILEEKDVEVNEKAQNYIDFMDHDKIVAMGVFDMSSLDDNNIGKYAEVRRLTGKGLNLYYSKEKQTYILERDNVEDIINEPFTNINYIIDINTNKAPNAIYDIVNVSSLSSPNTLKQGYIELDLGGKYERNGARIYIFVKKVC